MNDARDGITKKLAEEFAKRLRTARERQGLKQSDLGRAADLSPAAISQLENGERKPNFSTLVRLAQALKTTPDALIGVSGSGTEEPELRALFRNLEGLSQNDLNSVRSFIHFLKSDN